MPQQAIQDNYLVWDNASQIAAQGGSLINVGVEDVYLSQYNNPLVASDSLVLTPGGTVPWAMNLACWAQCKSSKQSTVYVTPLALPFAPGPTPNIVSISGQPLSIVENFPPIGAIPAAVLTTGVVLLPTPPVGSSWILHDMDLINNASALTVASPSGTTIGYGETTAGVPDHIHFNGYVCPVNAEVVAQTVSATVNVVLRYSNTSY